MANQVVGYFDAPNQRIVLAIVDTDNLPPDGDPFPAINAGFCNVVIDLADGNLKTIKLKEWPVCVDDGTGTLVQKHAIFLSSDPY